MKRLFLLSIIFVFIDIFLSSAVSMSSTTEKIVTDFYSNIKLLTEIQDGDEAYYAEEKCKNNCVAPSEDGLYFPNDFRAMGATNEELLSVNTANTITIKTYIAVLKRFSRNRKIDFTFSIDKGNSRTFCEPELKGESVSFSSVVVNKNYGGVNKGIFIDTIVVDNSNNKILSIGNRAGGKSFSHDTDNNVVPTPTIDNDVTDVTDLTITAASLYTRKLYYSAYKTYLDIISIDNTNANAYYRLAIMSYRRKGCDDIPKRQTDKLAIEYLNKAYQYGNVNLKEKIGNILYYWN